ncbi:DEHA2B15950p [Debaryomyces hansenii CBS767]|uniref:DEHA2B15950p n=1 Tax=Debaryomyces hansenii (strain ATCC 36239 / CBS 767 / BCRC 21394 / JCM 1990 / NBRC 0083 / IGC 2968) TaxID=284592 RepID=B5RSW9_DEBHA|nr:DEHA2B15950p [Debaryomyces hansenii CBS767]CAR65506.1 DEHA2B15950p [Debaryomyces hansenii CBS767]|eukprot:XP_002770137.1 DEHA2B15950p [Debaryomyces hansenii CBS767]
MIEGFTYRVVSKTLSGGFKLFISSDMSDSSSVEPYATSRWSHRYVRRGLLMNYAAYRFTNHRYVRLS